MYKKSPLISIIVPVYNTEIFIEKCIESIRKQTYHNLEIILVDDGSTDRSGQICEEKALIDSRIIVCHKKNAGQGSARNKGLDICTGEYIAFLDSDDSMEMICIESLYTFLVNENLDISSCNYSRYSENGEYLSLFNVSHENFIIDGVEAQRRIWYAECINLAPWGKLFKRELWDNVRFTECMYYEDYATMHKIYLYVERFGYIRDAYIRYSIRHNSSVRTFNELKLLILDIADETIDYCTQNKPEVLNAAIKKAVNTYFHILLNMPINELQYRDYYERIIKFLKKYRWNVLKDKRADSKVKGALLLLLFGYRITKFVFLQKKKRDILF